MDEFIPKPYPFSFVVVDVIAIFHYHSIFSGSAKIILFLKWRNKNKLRSFFAEFLKNYCLLKSKFVYRCFLWAWQCSPTKNCVVPLHCINYFSLFNFVYVINLKNKSCSLVPNGMLVVSGVFFFLHMRFWDQNLCYDTILVMKNMRIFFI